MKELFSKNLKYLRKQNNKSQSDIGLQLNKAHTSIGNWEKGIAEPSLDEIKEIARIFEISPADLLFKDLSAGKVISETEEHEIASKGKGIGKGIGKLNDQNDAKKPSLLDKNYGSKTPKVITLDASGAENIIYVPVQARAGYLLGYGDTNYIETLPAFTMPGMRNGTYRMFEVEGASMTPTLMSGDRIICRWLPNFNEIRDNHVHVVVTKDGIVIKRVLNRVAQRGKIVLKSDTVTNRKDHPTYEINPEDVLEMWYSVFKVSADLSEPAEMYHRVADLEADMVELRGINSTFKEELKDIKALLSKGKK
ncbi:MAG: helix-turn-helix domain-containing protein [Flavipsychrobacter sp.]